MPLMLNETEVKDLWINGTRVDFAKLNSVDVWRRGGYENKLIFSKAQIGQPTFPIEFGQTQFPGKTVIGVAVAGEFTGSFNSSYVDALAGTVETLALNSVHRRFILKSDNLGGFSFRWRIGTGTNIGQYSVAYVFEGEITGSISERNSVISFDAGDSIILVGTDFGQYDAILNGELTMIDTEDIAASQNYYRTRVSVYVAGSQGSVTIIGSGVDRATVIKGA